MSLLLATRPDDPDRADWARRLRAAMPGETLWLDLPPDPAAVEIAIVANPPPGSLAGLPKLRWIQSLWAGVDRLLADPTIPPSIPIARMVDPTMSEAMAQTALWAVLSLHRRFLDYAAQQRSGVWREHGQRRAGEVPVLVLGLGRIGDAVARRLAANGYPVAGWRRGSGTADAAPAAQDPAGLNRFAGDEVLPELLARSEIVVNLLPLTPATRNFFDAARFAAMREGAALLNFGRGGQVVEADLIAALSGLRPHLSHAVLDVFAREPLPAGHPFWSHPRITLLPHVAAITDPRSAAAIVAANIADWRAGRPIANLADRGRGY